MSLSQLCLGVKLWTDSDLLSGRGEDGDLESVMQTRALRGSWVKSGGNRLLALLGELCELTPLKTSFF